MSLIKRLRQIVRLVLREGPAYLVSRHAELFGLHWTRMVIAAWERVGLGFLVEEGWRKYLVRNNQASELIAWSEKRMLRSGMHPYWCFRLVDAHVEMRQFAAARKKFDELAPRAFSDPRLKRDLLTKLRIAESIVDLEENYNKFNYSLMKFPIDNSVYSYLYKRMWDFHGELNTNKLNDFIGFCLFCYNYKPEIFHELYEKFLAPNGMLNEAKSYLSSSVDLWGQRPKAGRNHPEKEQDDPGADSERTRRPINKKRAAQQQLLNSIAIEIDGELGDKVAQEKFIERARSNVEDGKLVRMAAQYHLAHEEFEAAKILLEQNIAAARVNHSTFGRSGNAEVRETSRLLGITYEYLHEYDAAIDAYRRSAEASRAEEWLSGANWLLVSALLYKGRNAEAGAVMRQQLAGFWKGFAGLSRKNPFKRIRSGKLIPEGDSVVLGGRGIGDEILRFAFLRGVRMPRAKYYYTGELRLADLLQPGNDWVEFLVVSRTVGQHAVSEEQYWADREGVPARFDPNRVTRRVLEKIRQVPNLLVSEDVQVAALGMGRDFPPDSAPLVHLSEAERLKARHWLQTLPGKVKVGISWRSGDRNIIRDRSYVAIESCGPLLSVPGVDFVNLQYTDTEEECANVQARYGVQIHSMPGLDLRDDLRGIAALARECDIVIAPCTAIRELAGAAGARVWSLTITPFMPDLWRIGPDGRRDLYFPTMVHFTAMELGDAQGVINAMAQELATLVQQK